MKAEYDKLIQEKKKLEDLQARGESYYDKEAAENILEAHEQYAASTDTSKITENRAIIIRALKMIAIAKESQIIIENARKLYPVIDFRDWANVDLIIFIMRRVVPIP